jgi:hypothetical protein
MVELVRLQSTYAQNLLVENLPIQIGQSLVWPDQGCDQAPQQKFVGAPKTKGTAGRPLLPQDMNFITFQDLRLRIQQAIKNNAFIRAVYADCSC